ncbi:MAG: hypothetical protein IJH84_16415 [Saccharopolyspora sp.]|uniref:hypothetical protein n=1 Tax=Saccharopolyspora TaxID=1835 RepID=UPI00190BF3F1|nr:MULTISPECIES: hypothetical protein [unclassified Saccharopolyspora]MBK0866439.1 hypothetical protein [Saccharopolyspora sp. HNM0986]MBQ6642597.1 hypothetical protein [Saccharopolyspora sp.]
MTTASTPALPSYSLLLPEGFIELPGGEPTDAKLHALASTIAFRFGLPADTEVDQSLAGTAAMLMTLGASAEAGGAHYSAAAVFRSAQQSDRPLMVVVSCFIVMSEHASPRTAVAGLEEYYNNEPGTDVEQVRLPAGDAVVTKTASNSTIEANDQVVEISSHAITAWVPNPAGPGILNVSITSNNPEDWTDIVDLAHGIFETVEWAPREEPVE